MAAARFLIAAMQLLCMPTPSQALLPGVVDRAIGVDPVWLTGAAVSGNQPSKTLWIFHARGKVRVEGHEIRTGLIARFQWNGVDSPIVNAMVLDDVKRASVIPGGATSAIMSEYAFRPSEVFYPASGCYEFTIQLEHSTHRIVIEVK